MLKNYLKIALRNIKKHRGYSLINIGGLAFGMACGILILLWVQDEMSFDKFHNNSDDLYIIGTQDRSANDTRQSAGTPPALGPVLKAEYPEILNATRFVNGYANMVISYGDKRFNEYVRAADPSVLEMFTFPLVQGDPNTALLNPHSMIITERMGEKYFGNEDPIGKVLTIDNKYDFTVMGILQNMPHNSTLTFDFLVPIPFFKEYWGLDLNKWSNFAYTTYVQLQKGVSLEEVNRKIEGRIIRGGESKAEPFIVHFDRLYLHGLGSGGGRIMTIRLFALIALFVLLIACINFMNLTTARSRNRAREIGMRKVTGAYKKDIIRQFYGESILLSFISLIFAVILVALLLPVFNQLSAKELTLDFFCNPTFILSLVGIALFTGLIAGCYPALFMSAFQPIKVLQGSMVTGSKGSRFRKILVVIQFVISIFLIIGTTVIYRQLNYMRNIDLGFNKENLIYIRLNSTLKPNCEAAKQELLQNPNISNISLVSFTPIGVYSNDNGYDWDSKRSDMNPLVSRFCTDVDFLKTFEGEMALGEFYSKERTASSSPVSGKIIINEEFARILGMENPIGARLSRGSTNFRIIGVVKNFNFMPLYREIGPLAIYHQQERRMENRYRYMFMKVSPVDISQTVDYIQSVYEKYSPGYPFEFRFLEDVYGQIYRSEQRMGSIIKYFTILAILISCLGLFGLASFMAEQRTKEIGIRKVLGSSMQGIVLLLSREFMKWVLIANIIGWPVAYFAAVGWLQSFAYRTKVGLDIFLFSAALTLVVAFLTVGFQAVKAARANPVDALKYE